MKIFSPEVQNLVVAVEEGSRASKEIIDVFVEPASGTLSRAKSRRHHLIFGRRGSGKSSLLIKSAMDLAKSGFPVVYVDLEPFKGHQHPDIIISVLIVVIEKLRVFFEKYKVTPIKSNRKFWEFWKPKFSKKELERIFILNNLIQ